MQGLWEFPRWSSGPEDQRDVPRLKTGLEFVPRWGSIETENLVC